MEKGRLRILLHNDETAKLAARLREVVPDALISECNGYDDLPENVAEFAPGIIYSIRFAGTAGFPSAAMFASDSLRWIAVGGAGTDHLGSWDPDAVTITNSAGVAADMMAEYVFGAFLHFTLDIPGLQRSKAAHRWDTGRQMVPMHGRTVLIAGLGHTGQAIATRAKAFGMRVIGTRARPGATENVDHVGAPGDLKKMLPEADFVVVCSPLLPSTRGMIGAREIAVMKPGAILADVSRGGIVDQHALASALAEERLGGAALDVFETEPLPANSPLWDVESLLISPHCSSVYAGWAEASFELFLANLRRWQRGEALQNVVNPARGY